MGKLTFQCVCSSTWQTIASNDDGVKTCGFCGIPLTSPQPSSFFPASGSVVYRGTENTQVPYWNKAIVEDSVFKGWGSMEMLNGFRAVTVEGVAIRLSLSREGKEWSRTLSSSQEGGREEDEQAAFDLTHSRGYFPSEWFKYSSDQRKVALDLLRSAKNLYGQKSVATRLDLESLRKSLDEVASSVEESFFNEPALAKIARVLAEQKKRIELLRQDLAASGKRIVELECAEKMMDAYFDIAKKHIALLEKQVLTVKR